MIPFSNPVTLLLLPITVIPNELFKLFTSPIVVESVNPLISEKFPKKFRLLELLIKLSSPIIWDSLFRVDSLSLPKIQLLSSPVDKLFSPTRYTFEESKISLSIPKRVFLYV